MKTIAKLGLALALVVGLVAGATAGDETTMTGKIMCAKCALKKADAKECQDVLVVKDAKGGTAEYYLVKNMRGTSGSRLSFSAVTSGCHAAGTVPTGT